MNEVRIYQQIRSLFDRVPSRTCDEDGRVALESEIEEAINDEIRTMLGYQPSVYIKPVIALDKETRSAFLEELKVVPMSARYIGITVNTEGGGRHE